MKTHQTAFILSLITSLLFCANDGAVADQRQEQTATLNQVLYAYHSEFSAGGDFTVVNNFKNSAQGKTFHTLIAQKADRRIQIEITRGLNKNEAHTYSKTQYTVVQKLYGPRQIQYPGIITNATECPENKKTRETTVEIMNKTIPVLLANASDRYVLGVWDDDLIKQKAAFAVFYDETNATCYQIIVFQPFDHPSTKDLLAILAGFKIR